MDINYFPQLLIEKLGYYVYLYINPLNGQIFYIGKGHGSRCLAHLSDQTESRKVQTIREIQAADLQPKIEILVHGLEDEVTALKIEAAERYIYKPRYRATPISNPLGKHTIGIPPNKKLCYLQQKAGGQLFTSCFLLALLNPS